MKRLYKLLALFLCAGLLITSVPLKAKAETADIPDAGSGSMYYINPLYADALDSYAPALMAADVEMPVLGDEEYHTTVAAAGAYMRKQMVDRKVNVTVGIKTTDSDLYTMAYTLMDEAMKHTGVPNEGDYIQWQYSSWSGNYSYSKSGSYYLATYSFTMEYFTTAAQEQQATQKLNQIYSQLNLNNASDYKTVKGIYDYICSNITYDFANLDDDSYKLKHSAWAGLINNTCVCQGYALIFYRMCLNYGIDARLIAGDGGGPHGWNIVKMGNLYYNVDSTWDAGNSYYRYFLKGSNNFTDHQGWEDFTTPEFKRQYPISTTDYVSCEGSSDRNKHSYSYRTTVEPTCTTTGTAVEYCSVCGGKGNTTTLPSLGHNYQSGRCTRCGESNIPTSGTCGSNVSWRISGNLLHIYGSGEMTNFAAGGAPWAASADKITAVSVGEGVTTIGNCAFYNMSGIKSASLPSTLTSIGENSFLNCSSIEQIIIPYGVTSIGASAFSMCKSLGSIELPETCTDIKSMAFAYCTSLTKLTLPYNLKYIRNSAFYASGIKTLVFQGGVPSIAEYAFEGLSATVIYPDDPAWKLGATAQKYGGNITWRMEGEPLPAPVLRGNASATGQVKLTWNAVTGAENYYIYRAEENGSFGFLDRSRNVIYTDSRAALGKTYRYYVVAVDSFGAISPNSNIVSCKLSLLAPSVAIANVSSSGKIKLTWSAVPGAVEYKVYRATSKTGKYSPMKTLTGTSYTNTSAKAGTRYYYYVVAYAANGAKSDNSNIVNRTCDYACPNVTATNVASTGKIKLTWAKVEGATKYKVYRATSKNGKYSELKTVTGTSLTNTSVSVGKTYYYKVRAYGANSAATSAYSAVKSRTCDLARPTVKITTSSGKPKVSWSAVSGAKQYKIYRATSKTGEYKAVKTTTAKYWKDTTAKKGKTYYYKVVAVHKNSSANSAYSNIVYKKCTK